MGGTYHSGRDRWSEPRCARGACRVCRRCSLFLSFCVSDGVCVLRVLSRGSSTSKVLWFLIVGAIEHSPHWCSLYLYHKLRGLGALRGSGDEVHFQRWQTKWNWMTAANRIWLLDWLCRPKKKNKQLNRASECFYFCLNFLYFVFAMAIVFVWLASKRFDSRIGDKRGGSLGFTIRYNPKYERLIGWLVILEGRVADERRSNNRGALLERTVQPFLFWGGSKFWAPTLIAPDWLHLCLTLRFYFAKTNWLREVYMVYEVYACMCVAIR